MMSMICTLDFYISDDDVKVNMTAYFGELGFCTKMQTFYVGGYLRQMWNDPRYKII